MLNPDTVGAIWRYK